MAIENVYEECLRYFDNMDSFSARPWGTPVEDFKRVYKELAMTLSQDDQTKLHEEFFGLGPLAELVQDEDITEIIIQGPANIWYERFGESHQFTKSFLGPLTYKNFYLRTLDECSLVLTQKSPCGDSK